MPRKISLPRGFALWSETIQEKWLQDNSPEDPAFTQCECHHNRAQHSNSRGACRGYHCHCSRFVKRTRQFIHMKMMEAALLGAIEVIESLPGKGRIIKTGLPDWNERTLIIKQMKEAIVGPKAGTDAS
jgi:hypothetical protein